MRYWKCVKVDDDFPYFTVGKVYKSNEEGRNMIADDGFVFKALSVERLKKWYEFIEINPRIIITADGRKTTATLYEGDKPIRTRYCVCHADDKYDFIIGAEIAMKRLFDKNYARSKKIDFSKCFFVGDKVEVTKPCYAELYDTSFFAHENIDYFDDFLYGEEVEKNAFGTIVAKKGDMCLIDKATFEKGHHYVLVNEKGLKKL